MRARDVHPHRVASFNRWLAVTITTAVGSMWCAYLFALIAISGFPGLPVPEIVARYVQWFSQTFAQFTLLSIIMVGQAVAVLAADRQRERDHEIQGHVNDLASDTHVIQLEQLEILRCLHKDHDPSHDHAPLIST